MPPTFILVSMVILGVSTIMGVFTNSVIVLVNFVDKVKGKKLNPSDLILMTLGSLNIFFQFIMLINDYLSFLDHDLYSSYQIYTLFTVLLILPIFSSFWFTVCLSVYYYLQIVIFTHPFLMRMKLGVSRFIPKLLMASVFTSVANGLPAALNRHKDHLFLNMSSNQSLEVIVPKVNVVYMLPSTIISCSLPLAVIGVANGMIIKLLMKHSHKEDVNAQGNLSPRAEARRRAARTIGCLLLLYISFYISEVLLFIDTFPRNSFGFCACLIVIYSYPPAQSIVLILGCPKLKQVFFALLQCLFSKEQPKPPEIFCIKLQIRHFNSQHSNH
ncbi:PREDICTED: taste receptor type 2 member 40-like [Nanorana parkeri]|uniref:taste receptor type 2 member 40-like n=1 Tax=Nanorana parkeri TaxID=125878 RepID=UPI000854A193|nr:PREDICTED: taste receptor type 2 member 40-like [Nanorana parkeri]